MAIVNSLADLTSYLSTKTGALTLINTFVFGGLRQVMEKQQESNAYPIAAFPPPETEFGGDADNTQQFYQVELMVLTNADLLAASEFQTSLENMETAAKQLIKRFMLDFSLKPDRFRLVPVEGLTHDNLYGWQIEFSLPVYSTLCIDAEVWP